MLPYRDSRVIKITLAVFFALLLGYAYYEARAMLYGPRITVPTETIVVHEPFTVIQGRAEHISELRMNGAAISVTEDGYFEEPHLLTPGENRIILDATDRFGRTEQEIIEILYVPDESQPLVEEISSTREVAPED
ncbi:hypothetical protein HY969_04855 [Candidatus Kaiserbacteria bacterium]|nr:hypothetical protein [Candidatus Kaiserbacteria bacterium]